LHLLNQKIAIERLGYMDIGPSSQGDPFVDELAPGGQYQDRCASSARISAQPAAHLVAIHLWHHDVYDHDIGPR
jgi:hypothetical protein